MNTNEIEKNNKKQVIKSIILLIIVVAIVSLIGFALARYITQLNGNTEAQIARWDFKVTAGSSQNLNIDLSQTRYANDTNEVNREKVAPGTSGALVLNVDATNSQVSLKYDIDINLTQIPENLIFYSDSEMTNAMYKENGIIHLEGFFDQGANSKTEERTLYWQWPIETGSTQNEIDMNDLLDSNWVGTQPGISIQVTGRQVMQEQQTNKYAVTFDANGGTLQTYGNASQTTKMVTYGDTYGNLPIPSREGYIFKGWNGKNLFDENSILMAIPGAQYQNNHYIFTLLNANSKYGDVNSNSGKAIQISGIKEITQYTLTIKGYEENYNTQYGGLFFYLFYTDGTREFLNIDSLTERTWTITTRQGKTLSSIGITFGSGGAYHAYINHIQLEEGSTATAYEPYYITSSTEVVQNQNHTLTAIWEPALNSNP